MKATKIESVNYSEIILNRSYSSEIYLVSEQEIIKFAKVWDPREIHLNVEMANESVFAGIIGSSSHTIAIRTKLLFTMPEACKAVVATMGWNQLTLPTPLRPGDELMLTLKYISKRKSKSNSSLAICEQEITVINQNYEIKLIYLDTVAVSLKDETS